MPRSARSFARAFWRTNAIAPSTSGEHVTLLFEDELTIRYQIQEMLRIEKMFDEAGIQQELDAYNPLVPDGSNLKATMLLEYEDADARRAALAQLRGIEDHVCMRVAGFPVVQAIADEDLDRENDDKTSAVHFVRFELTPAMVAAFKAAHARCDQRRPPELPGRGRHDLAARAGDARVRLRLIPSAAEKAPEQGLLTGPSRGSSGIAAGSR